MGKTETVWDAAQQEYHEIDAPGPLTARQRESRRRSIASMIVDEGLTVRQIGEILKLHNSNVYRAVAGLRGAKFSDVPASWAENKRQAGPRAHAARKERERREGGRESGHSTEPEQMARVAGG